MAPSDGVAPPSSDGVCLVEARAITKRFRSTLAVDAVDLDLRRGEVLALLGPNGAGKTTTVRMLVGILRPDAGTITFHVDGRAVARPAAGDLGYLPEDRGLIRDVPVRRTLEHFAVLRGMDRGRARARAAEELERFGLGDRGDERVDRLSKGNQQKVQFLAAVLHQPRLAVLDEPFSGFDPVNQQRFVEEIRALRDRGTTVLLSAHQMDLVEQLADRLVLMDQGRVVLRGALPEIRRSTRSGARLAVGIGGAVDAHELESVAGVEQAEATGGGAWSLRLDPDVEVGAVLHALTGRWSVRDVSSSAERLHEIFLRTVGRSGLDEDDPREAAE